MIPEKMAFKLVAKYSRILPMNQTTLLDHKNCALVAVDEYIDYFKTFDGESITPSVITYWTKVKKEIEKL